jgi:hypothetical protein
MGSSEIILFGQLGAFIWFGFPLWQAYFLFRHWALGDL